MCNKLAKSQKLLSWRKLVTFTEKTCWDTKRLLKYKINTIDVLKLQIVKGTCTKCHWSFSLSNLIYSFRPVYKITWYGVTKVIVVVPIFYLVFTCLLKLRSYDLRLEEVLYKSDIEKKTWHSFLQLHSSCHCWNAVCSINLH